MNWMQKEIQLSPKPRGFHLVTREILEQLPELKNYKIGIAHIFICHTSASLTLNENADPDVRVDFESHLASKDLNRNCSESHSKVSDQKTGSAADP